MNPLLVAAASVFLPLALAAAEPDATTSTGMAFERNASEALQQMKTKAGSLKMRGVAVVAFIPGESTTGWISRMQVVDAFVLDKKANVLAIVYAKMAEMADTLQNSGSKVRPKYQGENAYQGGMISQVPGGYMMAAFSGGSGEDDLAAAKVGLDFLVRINEPPVGR